MPNVDTSEILSKIKDRKLDGDNNKERMQLINSVNSHILSEKD